MARILLFYEQRRNDDIVLGIAAGGGDKAHSPHGAVGADDCTTVDEVGNAGESCAIVTQFGITCEEVAAAQVDMSRLHLDTAAREGLGECVENPVAGVCRAGGAGNFVGI